MITKTDLAKVENSWAELPHKVSQGAQKNFAEFAASISAAWGRSDLEFNEDYFRRAVAKTIIFRNTEAMVSRQPWYQGGYRANVVTYTVAKLASMVAKRADNRKIDLLSIWGSQTLTPALEEQLTGIAESVFRVIVSPESGFQNVTEWCKRELCWKRVEQLNLRWNPRLEADLVDARQLASAGRSAKLQQKEDNSIAYQTSVVELGEGYWKKLVDWAEARHLLTSEEKALVRLVSDMSSAAFPNPRQCQKLLEIKSKVEMEGFTQAN